MKKVLISGKNFEKFSKKEVYFTDGYYKRVNETKIKTGDNYLSLIANGRGVRGFKHLLEKIYDTDSDAKVIFTNDNTRKEGHDWYINLDEYKKAVSAKFFALYRETGLDGALCYLSQKLPEYFSYDKAHFSEKDYKKITKNLPEILSRVKSKKDKDAVVDQSLSIIKELGEKKKKIKTEIDELEKIKNSSNIAVIQSGLNELRERINGEKKYRETSGRGNWQDWLKKNSWIFGVLYGDPYEKMRIGLKNIPDFLFPTLDGFIDIYEIKLPTHNVVVEDSSHNGSFAWGSEVNKAIGQCVNYLHEIELHQLELTSKIEDSYGVDINFIKPRAFIVIGSDKDIDSPLKQKALRKLNYSLHGIEVITYSDLERRGKQMLEIYGYKDDLQK